jgi:hypothetical protein
MWQRQSKVGLLLQAQPEQLCLTEQIDLPKQSSQAHLAKQQAAAKQPCHGQQIKLTKAAVKSTSAFGRLIC